MDFEYSTAQLDRLNYSVGIYTKRGEQECGDSYIIKKVGAKVLLAVIDGLGHGSEAAIACQRAMQLIQVSDCKQLIPLVEYCDKHLRNTRGVVMNIAMIDEAKKMLSMIGVGNVHGVLLREEVDTLSKESMLTQRGIVGYNLPKLQITSTRFNFGDLLVLATDGVKKEFRGDLRIFEQPSKMIYKIASTHFKREDDALILVARLEHKKKYDDENRS